MRPRDFDVPLVLVPLNAVCTREQGERHVRWISKELYTQVQCLVLLKQFQSRVDRARAEGYVDGAADYQIARLFRCTSQHDLEQWLQDYSGRAVLSCTLCGAVDVSLVLEIKDSASRTRLCYTCANKLEGLPELPSEAPSLLSMPLPRW